MGKGMTGARVHEIRAAHLHEGASHPHPIDMRLALCRIIVTTDTVKDV